MAGLILVYVAFLGQKQQLLYQEIEIALNREELQLTREELKGQKEELEKQNHLFRLQRFENTFFHLLSHMEDIVKGFEHTELVEKVSPYVLRSRRLLEDEKTPFEFVTTKGKNCFPIFYKELNEYIANNPQKAESAAIAEYFVQRLNIEHYFDYIKRVFIVIDNSENIDKKFYSDILRDHLSPHEIILLISYINTDRSPKELKRLMKIYWNLPED